MLPDSALTSVRVAKSDIPFVTHATNLGSQSHLTQQWTSMSQTYAAPCHLLTVNATQTLLSAFVLSKLDYCNSLLCGSP